MIKKIMFMLILLLLINSALAFELTSTAFINGGKIPQQYTCDGADVSPPLAWSAAPKDTKFFALVVADPDASAGTWYHWMVYNIPVKTHEFPQQVKLSNELQGKNSWGSSGYRGPCPPSGEHRYIFTLYALDDSFNLNAADIQQFQTAAKQHVLGQTQLMGKYKRK